MGWGAWVGLNSLLAFAVMLYLGNGHGSQRKSSLEANLALAGDHCGLLHQQDRLMHHEQRASPAAR